VSANTKFEVQELVGGRWVLREICNGAAAAEAQARQLADKGGVDGARVVRDWQRPDGLSVEKVIWEKVNQRRNEERMIPGQVDRAPVCREAADMFRSGSRAVMNRVLRPFLDRFNVTPTEVLHDYRIIKRLATKDNLMMLAVDRVATAQSRVAEEDARALAGHIHEMVEQITARARKAEQTIKQPPLKGGDFGAAYDRLTAKHGPDKGGYMAMVLLSRRLSEARSWLSKLDMVLDEIDTASGEAETLLDGVAADVLGAPTAIQDLLGDQRSLAAALHRLIDLSRGAWDAAEGPAARVNEMMRTRPLEATHEALVERIRRQLGGTAPLDRANPQNEREALRELLEHLIDSVALLGGPEMAEAAVMRSYRRMKHGGMVGKNEALDDLLRLLPDDRTRVLFLLELSGSALGRELRGQIGSHLRGAFGAAKSLDSLLAPNLSVLRKMELTAALYRQVMVADIAVDDRESYAERLDSLMAQFLVQQRVIEVLDNPADSLFDRAVRLVEFCASGFLTGGRALTMARERVLSHLRQPNFTQALVAHLPTKNEKETAIRSFYQLLSDAGFAM